ncbi:protein GbcA [Pseudomonas capeferrum]|nr:protein GbcA [Pseudomonas capeferrum]
MRKSGAAYIPIHDIGVLIATSLEGQGLARRNRIRPCRPWIWFPTAPDAHSTAPDHSFFPATALRHHKND